MSVAEKEISYSKYHDEIYRKLFLDYQSRRLSYDEFIKISRVMGTFFNFLIVKESLYK